MVDQEEQPEPTEYTTGITVILLANRGEVWFPERENPNDWEYPDLIPEGNM